MKNFLEIVAFLFTAVATAQIVNIPDPNFKNALINTFCFDVDGDGVGDATIDFNNDGEIQLSEAQIPTNLNISFLNIEDLTGINSFTNLIDLQIQGNNISTLNLQGLNNLINLKCSSNEIEMIDISENFLLEMLSASFNQITTIDLSNNQELSRTSLSSNSLESIDLDANIHLKKVFLSDNFLTNIDLSNLGELEQIDLGNNNLTEIDISNNQNLRSLDIQSNEFTNLDTSNMEQLEGLRISNNLITSIDINNLMDLSVFFCNNCPLEDILDFSNHDKLTRLRLENTLLSAIAIDNGFNGEITVLSLTNNENLSCVQIDDVNVNFNVYPYSEWEKDNTTDYSENCALGIDDNFLNAQVSIYPNPVKEVLFIETDFLSIDTITISDVQGNILLQTREHNGTDVSSLLKGIYFIALESQEGVVTKKFIKN